MDVISGIIGAILYRMRGGWKEGIVNRQLTRFMFLLPIAIAIVYTISTIPGPFTIGQAICALLAIGVTYFGIITGHGSYMDLGESHLKDDERIQPLVNIFIKEDGFARDFIGLSLTGVIVTLPLAVVYFTVGSPISGLLAVLAGCLKGVAYYLGQRLENPTLPWRFQGQTEIGEVFSGFFMYGLALHGFLALLLYGSAI